MAKANTHEQNIAMSLMVLGVVLGLAVATGWTLMAAGFIGWFASWFVRDLFALINHRKGKK